ncbi:hypothetical protein TNCV_1419901 [Trichonephila clavipes]|nr:hypothetical protein TNCV_1419901 [Trichonephila clavipes]
MNQDEIPEGCKLNFTGIVDDALRIAGELFPKQTLKKYIRKEVEIDTDGRVRSRRFEKKEKSLKERPASDPKCVVIHSSEDQFASFKIFVVIHFVFSSVVIEGQRIAS